MKKLFYLLFALSAIIMSPANLYAQDNSSNFIAYETQPDTYKFVIEGTVALDIPDSCYNVYLTDIDGVLTDNDKVACVKVKNKKFRFETDLNVIKQGRIRAIMPGNELCSAWINLYFIPGFTIYMTVHDGYYDIHNQNQYDFMVSAWQNEVPVSALLARLGMATSSNSHNNNTTKFATALAYYETLINGLKHQMDDIQGQPISGEATQKSILKILERIENINEKMETIVDDYAKEINK